MKVKQSLAIACSVVIVTTTTPLLVEARGGAGGGAHGGGHGQGNGAATHRSEQSRERSSNQREYTHEDARQLQQRQAGGDGSSPNLLNRDPRVNQRQENQKDRIQQGVKSGQLTKEEAQDLRSTQQEIRQEEKEYKSDGVLTKEERTDLHQDLNAASKEIYQEKHDAETQPGVTPAQPGKFGIHDPAINQRQESQKERIQDGVQSGELTRREALSLKEKELRAARLEKRLKEDGKLTPAEREQMQKLLNSLSKDVYKQKHDGQEQK